MLIEMKFAKAIAMTNINRINKL